MNWKIISIFTFISLVLGILTGFMSTYIPDQYFNIETGETILSIIQITAGTTVTFLVYGFLGFLQNANEYKHALTVFILSTLISSSIYVLLSENIITTIELLAIIPYYLIVAIVGVAAGKIINEKIT